MTHYSAIFAWKAFMALTWGFDCFKVREFSFSIGSLGKLKNSCWVAVVYSCMFDIFKAKLTNWYNKDLQTPCSRSTNASCRMPEHMATTERNPQRNHRTVLYTPVNTGSPISTSVVNAVIVFVMVLLDLAPEPLVGGFVSAAGALSSTTPSPAPCRGSGSP